MQGLASGVQSREGFNTTDEDEDENENEHFSLTLISSLAPGVRSAVLTRPLAAASVRAALLGRSAGMPESALNILLSPVFSLSVLTVLLLCLATTTRPA